MVFSCELVLTWVSPSVLDLCQKSGWKQNWFSRENWSSHKFHPQFQICIKRQDENSHTGWWKKGSKTGILLTWIALTQVSPPVLELPSPQLLLVILIFSIKSKGFLSQQNNSCKCCEQMLITSFIKQYSISLTFPNYIQTGDETGT